MSKQSLTIQRNKLIVGKNSKSYNDKHPENPVSLRPIHDAIKKVPKIIDGEGISHPNVKIISYLRRLGCKASRPQLRFLYS